MFSGIRLAIPKKIMRTIAMFKKGDNTIISIQLKKMRSGIKRIVYLSDFSSGNSFRRKVETGKEFQQKIVIQSLLYEFLVQMWSTFNQSRTSSESIRITTPETKIALFERPEYEKGAVKYSILWW